MKKNKKSSKYWQKRFEQIEESSNKVAYEVAKETDSMFQEAMDEIEKEVSVWYQRFATNNGISIDDARKWLKDSELEELKWDIEKYIKYGKENALNPKWMKELENASAKYHISRLEALKLQTRQTIEALYNNEEKVVNTMVERVYSDGYYHSMYEIQKGFNIGWDIAAIDQKKLQMIASKPWATDGKNFSDRIWQSKAQLIQELHSELTRTCILGKSPDEAIRSISKKFNTSKKQAGRLIMTEQAYFSSMAQKDVFNELDVEKYEIVATLDSRTSEICQDMDGHVFDMKDYVEGVTAPPFHPNCRTTTAPYFDDEFNIGERIARDDEGNTYYVPSNMTYHDWNEKYVMDDYMITNKIKIGKSNDLIKSTKLNNIPGKHYDNISDIIDNSNNVYTTALKKYKNKINIKSYNENEKSRYNPLFNNIRFNAKVDARNGYKTFFHEYSHMIDHKIGNPSQSKIFKGVLQNDFEVFKNRVKKMYNINDDKKLYSMLSKNLKKDNIHNSISDIIGGLTNNQCLGNAKHKLEYWDIDGKLEREFFAQLGSAMARNSEEELQNFKSVFPNGYDYFVKVMRGVK